MKDHALVAKYLRGLSYKKGSSQPRTDPMPLFRRCARSCNLYWTRNVETGHPCSLSSMHRRMTGVCISTSEYHLGTGQGVFHQDARIQGCLGSPESFTWSRQGSRSFGWHRLFSWCLKLQKLQLTAVAQRVNLDMVPGSAASTGRGNPPKIQNLETFETVALLIPEKHHKMPQELSICPYSDRMCRYLGTRSFNNTLRISTFEVAVWDNPKVSAAVSCFEKALSTENKPCSNKIPEAS